ncbi:MAG: type VII toxin-antitoxin system MntA family adenylyltransferase antitoxin [Methanothrix sp.]
MDKNKTKDSIRFILNGFEEIDLAYVFGSFLERDDFHDIDVAIHLCKEQSPYQRFKLAQRVARYLEKGVEPRVNFDVRILNYAPAYFQYEVISKGIVVLERDRERRVDYEAHLISEYLDLKYMYDLLDQAFLARA